MKTFTLSNGAEVKTGDDLTDAWGDQYTFIKALYPSGKNHGGRVQVRPQGQDYVQEFSAKFFNLKITE